MCSASFFPQIFIKMKKKEENFTRTNSSNTDAAEFNFLLLFFCLNQRFESLFRFEFFVPELFPPSPFQPTHSKIIIQPPSDEAHKSSEKNCHAVMFYFHSMPAEIIVVEKGRQTMNVSGRFPLLLFCMSHNKNPCTFRDFPRKIITLIKFFSYASHVIELLWLHKYKNYTFSLCVKR